MEMNSLSDTCGALLSGTRLFIRQLITGIKDNKTLYTV